MRRRRPEKRTILPDPTYKDYTVAKFINYLMKNGKKSIAEKIFYNCLDIISEKEKNENAIDIFKKALTNVSPALEVKSKRIGGATYQVPMEVSQARKLSLAMRWILNFSRSRNGRSMAHKLAGELMDAANEASNAVRKREETHKMAEANKAFAHYRY